MNPAMYIFVNKGLDMSPGKMAAQVAHAACLAADYSQCVQTSREGLPLHEDEIQYKENLWKTWWNTGHYTKFVMEAPDTDRLRAIERYLNDRGFETFLVIDEGRTENTYFQPTALAVELVDKDDDRTRSIFQNFKLYKE